MIIPSTKEKKSKVYHWHLISALSKLFLGYQKETDLPAYGNIFHIFFSSYFNRGIHLIVSYMTTI